MVRGFLVYELKALVYELIDSAVGEFERGIKIELFWMCIELIYDPSSLGHECE